MKKYFTLFIAVAISASMLFGQKQILPERVAKSNQMGKSRINLTLPRSVAETEFIFMHYAQTDDNGYYSPIAMEPGEMFGVRFVPDAFSLFLGDDPIMYGILLGATAQYADEGYDNETFTFNLYEDASFDENGILQGTNIYSNTVTGINSTAGVVEAYFENSMAIDVTKTYFLSFEAADSSVVLMSGRDLPAFNGFGNFQYAEGRWWTVYFGEEASPQYYPWVAGLYVSHEPRVGLKNTSSAQVFTVSPNPATDIIYIDNAAGSSLKIFDMTGKVMVERNIQSVNEAIEVSHLGKGIYFVEVTGKDNSKNTQKLIKQ